MNSTHHPNSVLYRNRRTDAHVARWKYVAELRAKGITCKDIGKEMGICPYRVHYLEQKWHSYRIANLNK